MKQTLICVGIRSVEMHNRGIRKKKKNIRVENTDVDKK